MVIYIMLLGVDRDRNGDFFAPLSATLCFALEPQYFCNKRLRELAGNCSDVVKSVTQIYFFQIVTSFVKLFLFIELTKRTSCIISNEYKVNNNLPAKYFMM
jgi:hypothetical protein